MNVLITAYDFPPYSTGGSIIRTIKHIKYLQKEGVKFYVISVKRSLPAGRNVYEEILNEVDVLYIRDPIRDLFDKVRQEGISISKSNRILSTILNLGKYLLKWILNNFLFPDQGFFWYRNAYKSGIKLFKKSSIDIVYSTFPEPSAHWLGYKLARQLKLPLVLDYRDLWSTNPLFGKNWLFNRIVNVRENKILAYAESVIFTTKMAMEKYIERKKVESGKAELIWNGYDPEDFLIGSDSTESFINKSFINFTYTGSVGDLISPRRNPKALLDAFKDYHSLNDKARLNFIGNLHEDVKKYIDNTEGVQYFPMVPNSMVPRILLDSDVLVVILTRAEDLTAVPGKLYEYMVSRKFILALTESESQVASLVESYNYGSVEKPDSKDLILKQLINAAKLVSTKISADQSIDKQFIEQFDRMKSAEKLYSIFESILTGITPEVKQQ